MKKCCSLFFIIATSILFFSCQKEVNGGPGPDLFTDKVKTYTEEVISDDLGNSTTTFNFSYDANDRITAMTSGTDPGGRFVFTYRTGAFSMDLLVSNVPEIHVDYFLNSNSLVDSLFQYNNTGDTATTKYVYNGNKQLIKMYEYEHSYISTDLYNTTSYTYDAAGNLMKSADSYGYVETFEYYPDLVYAMPSITPLVTSQKQNLVKKYTLTIVGSLAGSANYSYTFDSKNRLSTQKAEYSDGSIVNKTFTYF